MSLDNPLPVRVSPSKTILHPIRVVDIKGKITVTITHFFLLLFPFKDHEQDNLNYNVVFVSINGFGGVKLIEKRGES